MNLSPRTFRTSSLGSGKTTVYSARFTNGVDMSLAATQLFGAAASRKIDANAVAVLGISSFVLMQRAADVVFASLLESCPTVSRIRVFCGKGNNAGDAYLVAKLAADFGLICDVLTVVEPTELNRDAAQAYQLASAAGVPVRAFDSSCLPLSGDVIVDGLLGTGLRGAPRAPFINAIEAINGAKAFVLSIDIPSGVNADSGGVDEVAVRANLCISLITPKLGLYTGLGISHVERLEFADLGVPRQAYTELGVPLLHWSPNVLSDLERNSYKHSLGHVVIAGGDLNMPGAVMMASEAALRAGAGMVTVLTRVEHITAVVTHRPEVMVLGFDADGDQTKQQALLASATVVVCGPGLGREDWGRALYQLVQSNDGPTLLDADGLFWLAQEKNWRGGSLLMTPHAAEAGRLLESSATDVQRDRPASAVALSQKFKCAGVLKGAGSLIFDGPADENSAPALAVCGHGNAGMATAGMGDVLSGVVAGLWAAALVGKDHEQTLAGIRYQAIAQGVTLHSAAADRATDTTGQRSLLATDVTATLASCMVDEREA